MELKKIKRKTLFFLEKYFGAGLFLLLKLTYRFEYIGKYPNENVIIISWHRNLIPITCALLNKDITILVSTSKDGEFISGPLQALGFKTVRGSSSKKSLSALKSLIRVVKNNTIAISPDGPKGPIFKMKGGAAFLAFMSKKPIQPVSIEVDKEWLFNSWDRFRFPKPFSKIKVTFEEKIFVNSKDELESKHEEIENSVKKDLII